VTHESSKTGVTSKDTSRGNRETLV